MKERHPHCVLTIAGSDSSGGAGIQADIKAISAIGCYAASVITALTAQNTQGVQGIFAVPAAFVAAQMDSVFSDLTISAVKIGMLSDRDIIDVVATGLKKEAIQHVVLDPVMVAKGGAALLQADQVSYLKERLFPSATLITPNIQEAEQLLGQPIKTAVAMEAAAITLGGSFGMAVLVKGGHLNTLRSSDVLYDPKAGLSHWFHADRVGTPNTHGTGCTLASAIASFLAQGNELVPAIELAKQYLTKAIRSGSRFSIGKGHGPVDHFWQVLAPF